MSAVDTPATAIELAAMNAWADAALAHLEATVPSLLDTLRERLQALGAFSHRVFPRVVQSLPVLYMFCGADLLTAHALFPHAPEYVLVADFPTGHPSCFTDATCASRANESASAFFKHWANLRFARQSTNLMRRAFGLNEAQIGGGATRATAGQLGALLLSLRLMGHRSIVHASHGLVQAPQGLMTAPAAADGASPTTAISSPTIGRRLRGGAHRAALGRDATNITIPRLILVTPRGKVTYNSLLLRSDPSEHSSATKQFWPSMTRWAKGGSFVDAQLQTLAHSLQGTNAVGETTRGGGATAGQENGEGRMFVSMFKAAYAPAPRLRPLLTYARPL